MKHRNQKAQGIVEYALLLAFVVGVAVALFNSNGLANAIGKAFYEVSETINNAIDNSPEARKKRTQDMFADALKNAVRTGLIKMDTAGDWVEIDAMQEKNKQYKKGDIYIDGGGRLDNSRLTVDGKSYSQVGFLGLWEKLGIPNYKVDYKQDNGWTGVRVVSNGDGTYTSYYYSGDAGTVKEQKGISYADTNSMNNATLSDGQTKLKQREEQWSK